MRSHPGEIARVNREAEDRHRLVEIRRELESASAHLANALRLARSIEGSEFDQGLINRATEAIVSPFNRVRAYLGEKVED